MGGAPPPGGLISDINCRGVGGGQAPPPGFPGGPSLLGLGAGCVVRAWGRVLGESAHPCRVVLSRWVCAPLVCTVLWLFMVAWVCAVLAHAWSCAVMVCTGVCVCGWLGGYVVSCAAVTGHVAWCGAWVPGWLAGCVHGCVAGCLSGSPKNQGDFRRQIPGIFQRIFGLKIGAKNQRDFRADFRLIEALQKPKPKNHIKSAKPKLPKPKTQKRPKPAPNPQNPSRQNPKPTSNPP